MIRSHFARDLVLKLPRKNFFCVGCSAGEADSATWLDLAPPAAAAGGGAAGSGPVDLQSVLDAAAAKGSVAARRYSSFRARIRLQRGHGINGAREEAAVAVGGGRVAVAAPGDSALALYELKQNSEMPQDKARGNPSFLLSL